MDNFVKAQKKNKVACKDITNSINDLLDKTYLKHLGISFKESYKKCFKLEEKKTSHEKKKIERSIIRKTISKINEDNASTAVDRYYGQYGVSGKSWDSCIKKIF